MSINVTVSGNPVRIKRGKMVTASDDKNEFEKRRFMRLEQVRQQSKDIAENLRNRVKKGRAEHLSEVEKEGEIKLQNWQARKLLELQDQYQEALGELGLGFKNAREFDDEEEEILQQREENDKRAQMRGAMAAERLQIEKNEKSLKTAVPIQRKKFTRDLENERSRSKKSSVKTKKRFDSDAENKVPELLIEQSDSEEFAQLDKEQQTTVKVCKEQQTSAAEIAAITTDKAAQTQSILSEGTTISMPLNPILDTRISQRIKQRERLDKESNFCNLTEKTDLCICCQCRTKSHKVIEPKIAPQSKDTQTSFHNFNDILREQEIPTSSTDQLAGDMLKQAEIATNKIIPLKPLKSSKDRLVHMGEPPSRTQNNDHVKAYSKSFLPKTSVENIQGNEFHDMQESETITRKAIPTKPKITLKSAKDRLVHTGEPPSRAEHYDHPNRYSKSFVPKPSVEKIQENEIEITPNGISDEDIKEKRKRRDIEAQVRGQVAREKLRIQQEYNELLKKLPVLQKQERLLEIGEDRERYHMTDQRLSELEKKRQNRLDNAYEELFVRDPPSVTLPKKHGENKRCDQPTWDVDSNSKTRTIQLSRLLSDLKSQKSELLKEIETTLDVKSRSTDFTRSTKRKRSGEVSPTMTEKTKTSTGSIPTPRKKRKTKKIILQNCSTQTSPTTVVQSAATSPIAATPQPAPVCTCEHKTEEMCEVVIKIQEDGKPQIEVKPPFSEKSVIVADEVNETSRSWRDHLSQNNSKSTISTTYFDVPSVKKKSPSNGKKLDPRLLKYIKKLLSMSRASIDDLSVSTATEVSTPSHSLVETPANNPLMQLMNVMKYFNLDMAEVEKQLSYVSEDSSKHYNTCESLTVSSNGSLDTTRYKVYSETDGVNKGIQQYADIAASCSRKISDLTAKIERVRAEKKKILESSTSSSERDLTTTSYKDLPDKTDKDIARIFDVDFEFAEQLKQQSQQEREKDVITDTELLNRLNNLLKNDRKVVQATEKKVVQEGNKSVVAIVTTKNIVEETKDGKTVGFMSDKTNVALKPTTNENKTGFFLDIPKLPRLETPSLDRRKRRPPPTKSLRGINDMGTLHELSTIVEADSQISTKNEGKKDSNSSDDIETMETMLTSIGMEWAIPTLKKTREALAMTSSSSNSGSLKDFLNRLSNSNSGEGQTVSLIDVDNRLTSTPVAPGRTDGIFLTDSEISSVKEISGQESKEEVFYELSQEEMSLKSQ